MTAYDAHETSLKDVNGQSAVKRSPQAFRTAPAPSLAAEHGRTAPAALYGFPYGLHGPPQRPCRSHAAGPERYETPANETPRKDVNAQRPSTGHRGSCGDRSPAATTIRTGIAVANRRRSSEAAVRHDNGRPVWSTRSPPCV